MEKTNAFTFIYIKQAAKKDAPSVAPSDRKVALQTRRGAAGSLHLKPANAEIS